MTEDEEDSTKDEVPQRSDLLQDSNNNVHHDTEIEEGSTEKSRNVNIVGNGGGDKGRSNERTYALGHTLINTNNGVLCNAASGLDGPNVLVMWSATSSDMYNVVVKRASVKK